MWPFRKKPTAITPAVVEVQPPEVNVVLGDMPLERMREKARQEKDKLERIYLPHYAKLAQENAAKYADKYNELKHKHVRAVHILNIP